MRGEANPADLPLLVGGIPSGLTFRNGGACNAELGLDERFIQRLDHLHLTTEAVARSLPLALTAAKEQAAAETEDRAQDSTDRRREQRVQQGVRA